MIFGFVCCCQRAEKKATRTTTTRVAAAEKIYQQIKKLFIMLNVYELRRISLSVNNKTKAA